MVLNNTICWSDFTFNIEFSIIICLLFSCNLTCSDLSVIIKWVIKIEYQTHLTVETAVLSKDGRLALIWELSQVKNSSVQCCVLNPLKVTWDWFLLLSFYLYITDFISCLDSVRPLISIILPEFVMFPDLFCENFLSIVSHHPCNLCLSFTRCWCTDIEFQ